MSSSATARPLFATLAEKLRQGTKAHDLIAAMPLVVWNTLTMMGSLSPLGQQINRLFVRPDVPLCLSVLSRIAVLLFAIAVISLLFVRRPPQSSAQGWMPRIMGVVGTYLSVGIVLLSGGKLAPMSPLWSAISTLLILGGMGFACYAIFFLGRSFSVMPQARKLVTGGPYAAVRHPLYLGEAIATVGVLIPYISPLAVSLFTLQLACQLCRMHWEEQVLSRAFPEYESYKAVTARLLPGVY
jgi:protein-S-isoprenylcysteine O-methyltransferase Ste14